MRRAGQLALLHFPMTDLTAGKRRPVLLIARAPGPYEDWLVCMMSTQRQHALPGFDEIIDPSSEDFQASGLKVTSAVRISRVAIVSTDSLIGTIGEIRAERLERIRQKLVEWIGGTPRPVR